MLQSKPNLLFQESKKNKKIAAGSKDRTHTMQVAVKGHTTEP